MAVLDAIKRMTTFINSKTTTSSSTSSNATQKKTKQGFWHKFLSALKGFFAKK